MPSTNMVWVGTSALPDEPVEAEGFRVTQYLGGVDPGTFAAAFDVDLSRATRGGDGFYESRAPDRWILSIQPMFDNTMTSVDFAGRPCDGSEANAATVDKVKAMVTRIGGDPDDFDWATGTDTTSKQQVVRAEQRVGGRPSDAGDLTVTFAPDGRTCSIKANLATFKPTGRKVTLAGARDMFEDARRANPHVAEGRYVDVKASWTRETDVVYPEWRFTDEDGVGMTLGVSPRSGEPYARRDDALAEATQR